MRCITPLVRKQSPRLGIKSFQALDHLGPMDPWRVASFHCMLLYQACITSLASFTLLRWCEFTDLLHISSFWPKASSSCHRRSRPGLHVVSITGARRAMLCHASCLPCVSSEFVSVLKSLQEAFNLTGGKNQANHFRRAVMNLSWLWGHSPNRTTSHLWCLVWNPDWHCNIAGSQLK